MIEMRSYSMVSVGILCAYAEFGIKTGDVLTTSVDIKGVA